VVATLPYNVQWKAQNSVKHREWWRFFSRIPALMKYRDVRMAVWIHVITSLTVQFSLACLAYFFMDILGTNESMMATVVLAALGCAVLTGVFIKLFFATAEKRSILRAGLIVWSTFYWILPFITEFSWRLYPAALLIGAGLGISMVIPYAMIGDVADYVEFETGERQDGLLFGILHFLNKLLLGALLLAFQLGLHFTGFNQAESEVGSSTELMIRAGLLLPMLLLSIAFWANSNYTLTRHKMNEISQVLFERREITQFGTVELKEKL
jgi:Na+/melibiose symporter-like transporter